MNWSYGWLSSQSGTCPHMNILDHSAGTGASGAQRPWFDTFRTLKFWSYTSTEVAVGVFDKAAQIFLHVSQIIEDI